MGRVGREAKGRRGNHTPTAPDWCALTPAESRVTAQCRSRCGADYLRHSGLSLPPFLPGGEQTQGLIVEAMAAVKREASG
jgi:hypothetical protein